MQTKSEFKTFWSHQRRNWVATLLSTILGLASIGVIVTSSLIAFEILQLKWWSVLEWKTMLAIAIPALVLCWIMLNTLSTERYQLEFTRKPITLNDLLLKTKDVVKDALYEVISGSFNTVPRLQTLEALRHWLINKYTDLKHEATLLYASIALETNEAVTGIPELLTDLEGAVQNAERLAASEKQIYEQRRAHFVELHARAQAVKEEFGNNRPQLRQLLREVAELHEMLRAQVPDNVEPIRRN